jgi:hypothetical protein
MRRFATLVFIAPAIAMLAAFALSLGASAAPESASRPEILFVQAPIVRAGGLLDRFPQGSRIARLARGNKVPIILTAEFFAAADPQVSFDGATVLFAAKQDPAAHWQIWEMNVEGLAKRQVTHCPGDCVEPAYLPRDEVVFTGLVQEHGALVSQLFVCKRDGSDAHPITFGPGDYQVETVLKNGLILASARSPLLPRNGADKSRELYTLRPDGSGLASLRCDHQQPAIRTQAEELDDGSVVFVKSRGMGEELGGELATIRRGALHKSLVSPSPMLAWSARQLGPNKLVVARRAASSHGSGAMVDLYAFDAAHGQFAGLIYADPKLSSVEAVPVAAHPVPRWYWSTLNPDLKTGYFICLDAYLAEVPKGRLAGSLSKVRVLTLDTETNKETNLGEAPVDTDGSFYVAVPPDQPVRFELLDPGGRVVRAQRSWIWTRSGEEHGCVGCHEDRAVAPENRWPLTLRRLDTPTRLGVAGAPQPAH